MPQGNLVWTNSVEISSSDTFTVSWMRVVSVYAGATIEKQKSTSPAKQWGKPITRENKLKSVAHELTHARQYLKRELVAKDELTDGPMAKWCGKDMPYEYATEQNEPWEVEARLMEEKIYLKWENKRYK